MNANGLKDLNRSHHQKAAREMAYIFDDERLTLTERHILWKLTSIDTERFKITRSGLAKLTKHDEKTVDKAMRKFKEFGYLTSFSKRVSGKWATVYVIMDMELTVSEPEPCPTSPCPIQWGSKNTNTTTSVCIDSNADPEPEQVETISCSQREQSTTPTESVPTLEEVQTFAESIGARCNVKRYWLIRSENNWRTLAGKTVTNWRFDFQLWEMREKPSADSTNDAVNRSHDEVKPTAPCAAAPVQKPGEGWSYIKSQKKYIYTGFEQRDPSHWNFDDIDIDLDNYDGLTFKTKSGETVAF